MTTCARPAADAAIDLFQRRFLNRTDCVAVRTDRGTPRPVDANGTLDGLLRGHLLGDAAPIAKVRFRSSRGAGAMSGRFRIGSYCPAPDNSTRWLCLDFDGAGHAEALADPAAVARTAYDRFAAAGLPAYLERSGGGNGWHLWCFFDPPIPAAKAQALGRALAPTDAPLANGGVADPRSARGIEVFPKQAKIRKNGYGNLVWLPWWDGAPEGANLFYRPGDAGHLAPFTPEDLDVADTADVARVLADVAALEAAVAPGVDANTSSEHGATWAGWRRQALDALPLESVYSAWLTGRSSGPAWMECRDPSSPSGDTNPSAGVADGTGDAERGVFHSFISGKTSSVFDFLVEHGTATDFRGAMALVARYSGVALPKPPPAPRNASRPRIRVNNRQLRDVLADAWRVVHATNKRPALFVRSGIVVRLGTAEAGLRIETVEEAAMFGHLFRVANWVRVTQDAVLDTPPPKDVARDMLVNPAEDLPPLEAIVATPVFDSEGRLVSTPGYHREARLWLHRAPDLDVAEVPKQPADNDVRAARELILDELFVDFPFAAASDRAHAVATLILPFVRRMVSGCTPIHLIEAPTPGSGKGLLADIVAIVALGRPCDPTTITRDEDEARKKITSILARAQPLILIDNIRHGLDSAQLAAALTAETWSDRMLGQTKMIDLPNRATWLVTANNPRLSLEIARRCVRVRLDAKRDRPWERTGFKHAPLRDWARQNRATLVHAVLVLVQSWIAAERPACGATLGSFESWAEVVGGVLAHAGIEGFLGDAEDLYEHADTEGQEWRQLVTAWWEQHGGAWVASRDLLQITTEQDLLGQVIGDKSERSQLIRLGRALSAARDRHFGEHRIVAGRNSNTKAAQYRLVADDAGQSAPTDEAPAVTRGFGDGLDDLFPSLAGTM